MLLRLSALVASALVLAACDSNSIDIPKTDYKPPKYTPPKLNIPPLDFSALEKLMVCNKPPQDKDLTPELKNNALSVHEVIDLQDVENTDCDGKKTIDPKVAQNAFKPILQIEPPVTLSVKASRVEIENTTTCVTHTANQIGKWDPNKDAVKQQIFWILNPISLDEKNLIRVELTDSSAKFSQSMNVAKGPNLFNLTYKNSAGEEISHSQVLVNVAIESRQIPGLKHVDKCHQ